MFSAQTRTLLPLCCAVVACVLVAGCTSETVAEDPPQATGGGGTAETVSSTATGGSSSVGSGGAGGAGGATAFEFVEDFADTEHVDLDETTAHIDVTGGGIAAGQPIELEGVGDGDEPYAPEGPAELAAGEHAFSSITVADILIGDGDLTLRATGDVSFETGSDVFVDGDLLIVAGGAITFAGPVEVSGTLTIVQPGTAGVLFTGSDAFVHTSDTDAEDSGDIRIHSRGEVRVDGGAIVHTGKATGDGVRSGSLEVRAYGDIVLDDDGYFETHLGAGSSGGIALYTEGDLLMDRESYLITIGHDAGITVRAMGGIELRNDSYFITDTGGPIDVVAEGALLLEADSYFIADDDGPQPPDIEVTAASVTLLQASYLIAGDGGPGVRGGNVTVRVAGDVVLDELSYFISGVGPCAAGGTVTLEAEGGLLLAGDSYLIAGNSSAGEGCSATEGGDVLVTIGGTTDVQDTSDLLAGDGAPAGTVTVTEDADIVVAPIDAGLRSTLEVRSLPITTLVEPAVILEATATWLLPNDTSGAVTLLFGEGEPLALEDAVGAALPSGWRYHATLTTRMFDTAALDTIRLRYAAAP